MKSINLVKYVPIPVLIGIIFIISVTELYALKPPQQADSPSIPQLRKHGSATRLIVDGEPFLMLAGELHNSSSSSLEYMGPIWNKLVTLNLNTVLAPISWQLTEPGEGEFDFTLIEMDHTLTESYRLLLDMRPLLLQYQGSGKMYGILQQEGEDGRDIECSEYTAHIHFQPQSSENRPGFGLIIELAPDEFLIAGNHFLSRGYP